MTAASSIVSSSKHARRFVRLLGIEAAEAFEDAHETRYGRFTCPVPLKLAVHLNPADKFRACLLYAAERGTVRAERRPAHRIDRHVDLIAFLEGIERREGQAGLGPEGRHDQLVPSECLHRLLEFGVEPPCTLM